MNYNDVKNKYGNTQRGVGAVHREQVAPEDETFHSVYIGGVDRKNEMGIVEQAGKIHIRGVEYNLDEVYCVITTSKLINAKFIKSNGRDRLVCFSYRESDPPADFRGELCVPSEERNNNEKCRGCKSQILMVGILTDEKGKPKVNKDKKPIFIFVRGKGIKYGNVSDYLYSLSELEIEPYFENPTDESLTFEKNNVNPMRIVTKIIKGTAESVHGVKTVFNFETGVETSKKLVERLLELNTDVIEEFDKKFNWGVGLKKKAGSEPSYKSQSTQSYNPPPESQPTEEDVFGSIDDTTMDSNFDDDIPF